jgi:hypothetical protein
LVRFVAVVALLGFAIQAFRGVRWGYVGYILLGLAYFPYRVGFALRPRSCELAFGATQAVQSLSNHGHIWMFAVFFLMSSVQLRQPSARLTFAYASVATLLVGALVEVAQGVTGAGNCQLYDLIPDMVGLLLGAGILLVWRAARSSRRGLPEA